MNLWVAVPVYNEQKLVLTLLKRLHKIHQSGTVFNVVFCNNNSNDDTVPIIEDFIEDNDLPWVLIHEKTKGTGATADTAIRYAIKEGKATHVARTDADCLPTMNWLNRIIQIFTTSEARMISGRIVCRMDDTNITRFKAGIFNELVPLAATFGKLRPSNKGPEYKGNYVMTAGCNLAIESELYTESGGFSRSKIEDEHEDRTLINRVRKVTSHYGYFKDVIVEVSARRITEWGIVNTLRWYANHSFKPKHVDIR